jgi:hypothetical protein
VLVLTSTPRMNYELGSVMVDSIYCANCNADIGSMTVDQVVKAVAWRGEILCPSCRSRRCDYCSLIGLFALKANPHPDCVGLLVRRCYWCHQEERKNPQYFFSTLKQNLSRPPCLSSIRISQSLEPDGEVNQGGGSRVQ